MEDRLLEDLDDRDRNRPLADEQLSDFGRCGLFERGSQQTHGPVVVLGCFEYVGRLPATDPQLAYPAKAFEGRRHGLGADHLALRMQRNPSGGYRNDDCHPGERDANAHSAPSQRAP
jgi:hypothetical protein